MDRIGKYEIIDEIGAGGFGTVYRGRDTILKRMVAIKTCSSEDDLLRQRFRREAEIVAGLQHPNITTIHDLGEQDGVPYLVQEFLDGEDLSHIIGRRDDLSLDQRARMLFGVASGLAHAHANGIIHRDIKPSNIRVLSNGSVKVMDFGIAKIGDVQTELTRTGMMLGTGPYLAPEQLTDEQLDSRCDIFSFGVVAYELFAFQRPFEASTFSALLYKILNQPHEPIRELCPDLAEPLVELVERCLIKDRDRRIQSFEEIRSQLAQVLNISEERSLPTSSEVFLDPTVSYDSGSTHKQKPLSGGADENSATVLMSSAEANAAAMQEAAQRAPAAGGPTETTPAPGSRPTVPLIAAAVIVAGLAVASALWLRGGGDSAEPVSGQTQASASLSDPPSVGAAPGSASPDPSESATQGAPSPQTDAPSSPDAEASMPTPTRDEPSAAAAASEEAPTARPESPPPAEAREPATATPTIEPTPTPPDDARSVDQAPTRADSEDEPATDETPPDSVPATSATSGARTVSSSPATRPDVPTPSPPDTSRSSEPANDEPEPAPTPDPAIDEAGVRAAIDRYREAYEALDIGALAAAWPSLDGESKSRIERGFGAYQALTMTVDGCAIDVAGATATARCTVHQEVTPKGGRQLTSDREVEFRLAKRGDTWVIEDV